MNAKIFLFCSLALFAGSYAEEDDVYECMAYLFGEKEYEAPATTPAAAPKAEEVVTTSPEFESPEQLSTHNNVDSNSTNTPGSESGSPGKTESELHRNVAGAVKQCEKEVIDYCVAKTCPDFCKCPRSPTLQDRCNLECKVDKRCVLRLPTYNSFTDEDAANVAKWRSEKNLSPKLESTPTVIKYSSGIDNEPLDKQNFGQVFRCIYQKRATKSGADPTELWQDYKNSDYAKALAKNV